MKIVHVTPGTAGIFYCQNCLRDHALLKSLEGLGHDVQVVPMYLPLSFGDDNGIDGTPIFYGAVNIYLKEKFPFYRHVPEWMGRFLDSRALLRLAAKKSRPTRATGLEEMTISMLRGEDGGQASELDRLLKYLKKGVHPDVVHLSNGLLLGLVRRFKEELGAAVVCSLQDENEWIDLMDEAYQNDVWNIMAERAVDVDLFITPSKYYANKSQEQLQIPSEKIRVVFDGIDFKDYETSPLSFDPPVIGYLCRMSEYFGLGILVDGFLRLKEDNRFKDLKLHLTGGYSGDDKAFVTEILDRITRRGLIKDVQIFNEFEKEDRIQFLKSLTLLSVPVPGGEAFGAYQVEALAAGVPIVQPNVGCYPEFIELTNGGVIYEPNDGETLAETMSSLLTDPARVKKLGTQGREAVMRYFTIEDMTEDILRIYESLQK